MKKKKSRQDAEKYRKRLKFTYFIFLSSFFIMGFSKRYAATLPAGSTRDFFDFYLFFIFEHYLWPLIMMVGAYFAIRYTLARRGEVSRFRFISLFSFMASMFFFLLLIPTYFIFSGQKFMGFMFLFMPFPWLSSALQVAHTGAVYHNSFTQLFGPSGIKIAIWSYFAFQAFAYLPALFYGRRWFCSMTCPFMGSYSEVFGEVLPLIPHDKKRKKSKAVHPKILVILKFLRYFQLALTLFVHIGLFMLLIGVHFPVSFTWLIRIELIRFLVLDTYLANLLMWAIGGRIYCYYCSSGFLLGLVGRAVGQQIDTDKGTCIGCSQCNDACKMSIDIMSSAQQRKPVQSIDCVGCGLCVDACPKNCLQYSTAFTRYLLDKNPQ